MNIQTMGDGGQKPAKAASPSRAWLGALALTARLDETPARTLPIVIETQAALTPDAPALLSDVETLSFRELSHRANRYARWALKTGVTGGKAVCLLMPNRPDYLAFWLGVTRVGGVVALVNTNLAGPALAHAIAAANARHLVIAAELLERLATLPQDASTDVTVWVRGEAETHLHRLAPEDFSVEPLDESEMPRHPVTLDSPALYIYTSGTTGLPKAARISHRRILTWSLWFSGLMHVDTSDRMYDCLPMYHSIGGVVAPGALLAVGGSVVVRERFSVDAFWQDIVRWDCTLAQYIGELCRYLLKAAPSEFETAHRLRLCAGNGLRADVWPDFQRRFAIPRILEFYAATESNVSLYNAEGKVGAIGRIPPFLTHRFPIALVKVDADDGEPVRDAASRCVRCVNDEAGEAIGKVSSQRDDAGVAFEGYSDTQATQRKLLRDVFEEGDLWMRTGDLMRRDAQGYFYFVDRIGDTFRWKGENVSTQEIAGVIAAFPSVTDVDVYGVAIPAQDGKAGMAALVIDGPCDLAALHTHLAQHLPRYAQPLFLRLREKLDLTETFKHRKQDLVRDGFDPRNTTDPVYMLDASAGAYVPLDAARFADIISSAVRL